MKLKVLSLAALTLVHNFALQPEALAQATAFTYQGRLNDGANAANGRYDLRFAVFNIDSGGTPLGGWLTNSATAVSNGLFTVTLDFGNQFPGAPRWIELGVRTNGGGAFSTLAPRQRLTATPYAIQALNSDSATAVSGSIPAAQITGTVPLARLPVGLVTNGASGVNFSGTFTGDGAALTNVTAGALATRGVLAWGHNFYGQSSVPASAQSGVMAIAAGSSHTVALKCDGSVLAWGNNAAGQTTVPSGAQSGVVAIAAGQAHTVALKYDGSVLAWGNNNYGQTTAPAGAQSGVVAIAAGDFHTVALKNDGSVLAWGLNGSGQTTVPAGAQSGAVAIAAGGGHTVALMTDGSVLAWGNNNYGQSTVPAAAQSGVVAIAAGGSHTVALKNDGSMLAWGWNVVGQTTVPAGAQSGVVAIAAGDAHTVALKNDGSLLAWGYNNVGQTTVPAGAQSGGVAIAASGSHTVALVEQAVVVGKGGNSFSGNQTINGNVIASSDSTEAFEVRGAAAGYALYDRTTGGAGRWSMYALDGSLRFYGAGTDRMAVSSAGDVTALSFNATSDRNAKENFAPVESRTVLEKVAALPLSSWNYKADTGKRHLGPMAQDFHAAFGLGEDDKHIATVDADGVALAAIQGLNQKLTDELKRKETEITKLQLRLEALEQLILERKTK